ncbi:MAG: histidinol dehydrogenase [Hyphomonadaceae bacterium]|nr:histidinol dehydrogenase [Hyphomonadaceae bacterium]
MKRFVWSELDAKARQEALKRPANRADPEIAAVVQRIFADVEREGADAVKRWSVTIDKAEPVELALTPKAVDAARAKLAAEDLAALNLAVANVRGFHEATKPADSQVEVRAGVRCRRVWRAIESCGLYIPGGTAPLFSTLIMLAAPAAVAGVPQRVAVTPPSKAGVHPMMIAAAAACGLESIWIVGGAQAIAALTFGAGVPKADKIFGPGNAYVAEAKRFAAALPGGPAIDVPAGPSELMVIADEGADETIVAADLLSQAEHAEDAQVILATPSEAFAAAVEAAVERQVATLPRVEIARAALRHSRSFITADLAAAADIANAFAAEHLSLQVAEPEALIERITHAGAVFVGRYSGETFGDYISGPSHVLPTDGAARTWAGIGVASFMKSFTVQELSADAARLLAGPTARLARLEGLEAHARAADARAV